MKEFLFLGAIVSAAVILLTFYAVAFERSRPLEPGERLERLRRLMDQE